MKLAVKKNLLRLNDRVSFDSRRPFMPVRCILPSFPEYRFAPSVSRTCHSFMTFPGRVKNVTLSRFPE